MNKETYMNEKLGMFIHWGLYAIRSQGEWAIARERIPKEEYAQYIRMFNPVRFDAEQWVLAAKHAGMKYIVFTSKHHDGFCMFDSQYTDWKITNTPFGRDVLRELKDACDKYGMGFGIYYSIWDLWYPGLEGGEAAMGVDGELQGSSNEWTPSPEGVNYMHNQITELLTNYGKIDVFWFDVRRAAPEAYRGRELLQKMRQLQPEMLINDRLGIPADISTPENYIPAQGLRDAEGSPVVWESCMCANQNWAYVHDDDAYKSYDQVLQEMVEVVSKGGNLLLNVGPTALGEFPRPYYPGLLEYMHDWLSYNSEAVYDTTPSEFQVVNHFRYRAVTTQKDENTVYIHVLHYPVNGKICIPGIPGKEPDMAYLLSDGTQVFWEKGNYYSRNPQHMTLQLPLRPSHSGVNTLVLKLRDAR